MITFKEFLNERINLSQSKSFVYFKAIQKRLGARKFDVIEIKDGTKILFDTLHSFLIIDGAIVAYNLDGSDNFTQIPSVINSFNDLEKNIKLLNAFKGTTKPANNFKNEVGIPIEPEEDLKKYGIKELKDGLTLERIKKDFPWILKAKIQDAVLGLDRGWLEWKAGTWEGGVWKGGTWEYGTWKNGIREN